MANSGLGQVFLIKKDLHQPQFLSSFFFKDNRILSLLWGDQRMSLGKHYVHFVR